jgi:hypothetical protein
VLASYKQVCDFVIQQAEGLSDGLSKSKRQLSDSATVHAPTPLKKQKQAHRLPIKSRAIIIDSPMSDTPPPDHPLEPPGKFESHVSLDCLSQDTSGLSLHSNFGTLSRSPSPTKSWQHNVPLSVPSVIGYEESKPPHSRSVASPSPSLYHSVEVEDSMPLMVMDDDPASSDKSAFAALFDAL